MRSIIPILINLLFAISTFAQSGDSLLNQLAAKWENAKAHTLKLAELMPEEYYHYKPVPEIMSFKEQLLHMAGNMEWLSSSFLFAERNAIKPDTATMSKAAVIKYVSEAYDRATPAHQNVSQKQLNEVLPFFAGPMARRQMLILMHDHQTHHAGQLILYLRLKGIKPPSYVGW